MTDKICIGLHKGLHILNHTRRCKNVFCPGYNPDKKDEAVTEQVEVPAEEINYMSSNEFRKLGFLQEVNRLVLHPAGLALAVELSDDETFKAYIWDHRDDPEGIIFGNDVLDKEKADRVADEVEKHVEARLSLLGSYTQQPKDK